MRRTLFLTTIIILVSLLLPQSAQAQKKGGKAKPKTTMTAEERDDIYSQCIDAYKNYEFVKAASLLDKYEEALDKAEIESGDTLAALRWRLLAGKDMLAHVAKVEVIDSLVVAKSEFFKHYRLTDEAGCLFIPDGGSSVAFMPQSADRMMTSLPDANGTVSLAEEIRLLDGSWERHDSEGLDRLNEGGDASYPFMLPDGITLYYANNGEYSLGGYDIFIARKDTETGAFLAPQNMGMPYNSPFDDYLLAIDENTGVGWWATDRNQIPDSVTIYVFIPSKVRENFDMLKSNIVRYARIDDIRATWKEGADYSEVLSRLAAVGETAPTGKTHSSTYEPFHLKKGVVYNSPEDARTAKGKERLEEYYTAKAQYDEKHQELKKLRHKFAAGATESLKNQILQLEKSLEKRRVELQSLANEVRRAEM